MIDDVIKRHLKEKINRFKVGDKVRVVAKNRDFQGKEGKVTLIDGEYHYVEIFMGNKHGYVQTEWYRYEIEKI